MKILLIIALVSPFIGLKALAGEERVPESVSQAFAAEHPNAVKVEWKVKSKSYLVKFKENGLKKKTSFGLDGNKLKWETEVDNDELPLKLQTHIDKNYPDYKIKSAILKSKPEGSKYDVEVVKKLKLRYSEKGEFIEEKD